MNIALLYLAGNASTLNYEIMMQKNQGNAYMYTEAKGFDAPGMAKSHIRVSYKFPLVSLITMLIPSSDWFVGIKKVWTCFVLSRIPILWVTENFHYKQQFVYSRRMAFHYVFNPFTPKFKKYIRPTFLKRNV